MKNIIPIFDGVVENGKLFLRNRKLFDEQVSKLSGDVILTVKPKEKIRTPKENRYYWGVVIPILMNHFGYTKDEMHTSLGAMFYIDRSTQRIPLVNKMVIFMERINTPPNILRLITVELDRLFGGVMVDKNPPKIQSMTAMTTVEFEEKMTEIRAWASTEHGIYIPLPNEALPQK